MFESSEEEEESGSGEPGTRQVVDVEDLGRMAELMAKAKVDTEKKS